MVTQQAAKPPSKRMLAEADAREAAATEAAPVESDAPERQVIELDINEVAAGFIEDVEDLLDVSFGEVFAILADPKRPQRKVYSALYAAHLRSQDPELSLAAAMEQARAVKALGGSKVLLTSEGDEDDGSDPTERSVDADESEG